MKQKTKFIVALALVAAALLGAAAAAGLSRQITVTLRPDITVQVNGVPQTIYDSTGKEAAPIIYNGTTYLPVKSIGQVLGQDVAWNSQTNTVIISSPNAGTSANTSANAGSTLIGEARAKEIALDHANLSASSVTFIQCWPDWENGRQVYDVEFYNGANEYDYEIDALTGEILSYDYDAEHYTPPQSAATASSTLIGSERAKEIALAHAGVSASSVTFVHSKLDWDDGLRIYEVEFYSSSKEYDYEIDAYTGSIISYDYDAEHYTPPQGAATASSTLIGSERAKEVALAHAGVSASNATFLRSRLDWDDGLRIYEVEFYSGANEYDYEIDAYTGDVVSYDFDAEGYAPAGTGSSSGYITQEQAKKLAQDRAPGATLVEIKFDYDDGRAIYEGELRNGRREYEFEIDAATGQFLKWEEDYD